VLRQNGQLPAGAGDGKSFAAFSPPKTGHARTPRERAEHSGSKVQVLLNAGDGSQMPVQISIRPLSKNGSKSATIAMVVTDMTEARRSEELLRTLTQRVVQTQEAERGRVATNCASTLPSFSTSSLAAAGRWRKTSGCDSSACVDTTKMHEMVSRMPKKWSASGAVCGPTSWKNWSGPALEKASAEFVERTGVSLQMDCSALTNACLPQPSWLSTASSSKL